VHVAWNGTKGARPENPNGGAPMLYARSNGERTAFEPQRNLMQWTSGLDGGGTVAADGQGAVIVAWHGRAKDAPAGEIGRRFFVARSSDDGATFAPEEPALAQETGACACCGTRAFFDRAGTFYALYRAATNNVDRDMILVASRDWDRGYQTEVIHKWRFNACPMSSESLAEGGAGVLAAWETKGQVYFGRIAPKTLAIRPIPAPGRGGSRKHPALASNAHGETILVWAEGTAWQKGGDLVWQVFDPSGRPTGEAGRIEGGIPVWGLPTVVARPDGGFTILH
ncbi:MAG: hypothetical protein IRY99_19025, partial [Isosphaeraceae bacterium]|nr:hypothetical protein [Isosphaeraceae bacterium]